MAAVEKKAEADDGGMVVACRLKGGGRKAFARTREVGRDLIVRPFVVPPFVCLRLDPDENGAPERVELSGAEALGASQFGFHALAFCAPTCATSSSTPQSRARVRKRCCRAEGEGVKSLWRSILDMRIEGDWRAQVISPEAEKSTLGWVRTASRRSRMRALSPMARSCATNLEQRLAVKSSVGHAAGDVCSLSLSSTEWSSKVRPS